MTERTLNTKKQKYFQWFLKLPLKWPGSARVLEYLLNNDTLLSKVHFVEDLSPYPTALLVSAENSPTYPFLFRVNGEYLYEPSQVITFLMEQPPHDIYVWLSFDRQYLYSLWEDLLEDVQLAEKYPRKQPHNTSNYNDIFTEISNRWRKKAEIMAAIDRALDESDFAELQKLALQLKEVLGQPEELNKE